jgi:hypothetical protein
MNAFEIIQALLKGPHFVYLDAEFLFEIFDVAFVELRFFENDFDFVLYGFE